MFPISDTGAAAVGQITADQKASKRGYLEARYTYKSPVALGYAMGNLTAAGVADDYSTQTGNEQYRDTATD
jgi:hypothetical protein